MRIRSHPFPDAAALPYWIWDDDQTLKAHPAYRQAKAGEQDAAIDLVWDLAMDFLRTLLPKLPLELTYVAPYAREASGDNAIPLVLASACAQILHGEVETEIVQASRVLHRRQGDGAPAAAAPVRWASHPRHGLLPGRRRDLPGRHPGRTGGLH